MLTVVDDVLLAAVVATDDAVFITELLLDALETDVTMLNLRECAQPSPGMDIRREDCKSGATARPGPKYLKTRGK